MSAAILDEITARTASDLQALKERVSEELLCRHARNALPTADFRAALQRRHGDSAPRIIAEIKKASPSKGIIRRNFEVVQLARELAANGAAALSVLTEQHYFQGGFRKLRIAADVAPIPILCKDFIIDPYQIFEARVFGADAVLLIAAALDAERFKELRAEAGELGLAVLAEVHNEAELDMVLTAGADIVGVNSRDLKTFTTDLGLTDKLLRTIPENVVRVAESGINRPEDIVRLSEAGADAFLIGESLMREASPGRQLRQFLKAGALSLSGA